MSRSKRTPVSTHNPNRRCSAGYFVWQVISTWRTAVVRSPTLKYATLAASKQGLHESILVDPTNLKNHQSTSSNGMMLRSWCKTRLSYQRIKRQRLIPPHLLTKQKIQFLIGCELFTWLTSVGSRTSHGMSSKMSSTSLFFNSQHTTHVLYKMPTCCGEPFGSPCKQMH